MDQAPSHPRALHNFDKAQIPDGKIRDYALKNSGKKRPFEALGFSLEAGNWEALRDAILEELPACPAVFQRANEYGSFFEVVTPIRGPEGKVAPVKTYWFYKPGEDFPRLATLFIRPHEWDLWEKGETEHH